MENIFENMETILNDRISKQNILEKHFIDHKDNVRMSPKLLNWHHCRHYHLEPLIL